MGNSYAGQLKTTRFEEVLHNSIEASLRSNNLVPRPIFSQLYLEAEQQLSSLEAGSRVENEEEEEEEDDGSESNSPPLSYQMKPVPEGCCTIDGFCQAGKDLRLVSICSEPIEAPPGFLLVGAKSPNLPDHLLVCAVDKRFLPDDNGHNALLGFSGNCVGCGEKGFRYFTEFSNHINLKLTTQPKKQKHLKYYLIRNAQGLLVKGCLIYWKGTEMRGRQPLSNLGSNSLIKHSEGAGSILTKTSDPVYAVNPNIPNGTHLTGSSLDTSTATVQLSTNALSAKDSQKHQQANKSNLTAPTRPTVLGTLTNSGPPKKRHKGWSPESPTAVETINVISTVSRNKPEDTVSHYVQHTPIVPEGTRTSYGQHSSVVSESTGTPYGQHSSAVQEGTGAPYVQHSSVVPESPGMAYLQHSSVIQEGIGTAYVHLTSSVQEGTGMPYLQHSSLGASLPSPMVASGEPVSVPDNLLHKCMSKPVIFKGHGNFPYLCGNLNDIIVSPLLTACYRNSQSIPKAYEQYGASAIIPISEEMQLLLTVYYLVQLATDQIPLIEDLEQIFMRSWRESHLTEIRQYPQAVSHAFPQMPNYLSLVTTAQLPWLAGLAASSCNESVKIIECSYSLAEGLSEMFKLLIEGKLEKTNYVVMMCATRARSLDSCIAVTGKHQSRVLAESMLTPVEYLKEVNFELMTGRVEILGAFFSTLCPEDDIDVLLEKFFQENQGHISPSLNTALSKSTAAEGNGSATCTSYTVEWHEIRPSQIAMAQKLLSHICSIADSSTQNLDLGSFEKVDFLICVPPSEVTYQQTLFHLVHSGVLMELGLEEEPLTKLQAEQYVMKLDSDAQTKFKAFLHRSMQNPHTLFILIHDHAHWDLGSALHSPYPHADTSVGLVDRLLNCREVKDAPNIVVLHVTSFPYALQTQYTHVSPYNEIHWPPLYSHGVDLYQETKKYFGLSEFIDSTMSGHSLPMLRYDSSFEAMIMTLAKRFPKLQSAVIRTFVLIQHYSAALMVVCGLSQMKNYTSVETLEIIQNLLNSPRQCTSGHGLMVLLRVPCVPLATLAYERLCHVREKLALADQFEILLGNPAAGLSIGTYFVEKLKTWQKIDDPDWQPQTYLELEGLPCILIFSGMDPQGESLPRSLRYCDLRLVNSSSLVRTSLEQELGLASYFLSSSIPSEKGVTSDVLESDPEKLSSTDNEDEELVTEGSTSDKRSPVTRERSHSQDSGSSSMSSKASSLAFCGELSASVAKEDTPKSPSQTVISSPEDNALSCGKVKADKHGLSNGSKQCSNTGEMVDISNSAKQNIKPSSVSVSSSSSSSSSSPSSLSTTAHKPFVLQTSHCIMIKAIKQPPVTFLPKLIYDIVTSTDSSALPKSSSLLPHHSVMWASSFRPLLTKMMTSTEQSLYYRQWTLPKQIHMDYSNRGDGRMDTFHPRRLLLSGPSQIGKTGAYLQFLSILSRMLIRLTEVDVYDEEEINTYLRDEIDPCYHQPGDEWPDCETFKKMPFDYTIHDPKYEDASLIWSNRLNSMNDDHEQLCNQASTSKRSSEACFSGCSSNSEDLEVKIDIFEDGQDCRYLPETKADTLANRRQEDMYLRRQTTRIRLSKYAAYNTYHHCEQCYQYMGFNPKYPLYESTLHAFSFSYSMIGEEVQLHFIIPKSKEHHFTFSQPGGQLESMRLPLVTEKNPDYVRSPIFTPTTGRHEHGLFNLYHAMDGAGHLHILVVKEYEMAIYKKYWPNHIMLVLPSIFNSAGVGAAHFLIKELSYHNLELERNRQGEFGVKPQDIWPFIIIADDSCVMWNTVDVSNNEEYRNREHLFSERNVSFKCVLQHMEALPNITHYALLGMRKWSSKTKSCDIKEPFSRCHLHDFILLNVDLTQNVQYNQNRFTCNDVDFNLRAHSSGLLICRFNRFSVMKKHIAVGGHRSFHIKPKMCDTPMSISPAQYICAPDSKHTFLAAPAQLLLEKYLQYNSHRFFSLSLKAYRHPVLSVDCYLNLGPQIAVCYVSSRPHSINISCSALIFSGLVLHLCDSFVVASFLKQFNFLKGATLCVISQDRNSLRQLVARLELEEEWQFRLRDEFQTANAKQDHPLFFLTGRHI